MKKNNISPEYPDFWNQKYINNDAQWDIGSPTPIFINWSKTLSDRKKILIPGAGRGHDALYFGQKNHDVYAIDFSYEAIKYLKSKSNQLNIKVNAICEDFFNLSNYFGTMDIILEYTFFCAINPKLRMKYINETLKLLKDNGLFVGIFLPLDKPLSDGGPPYGINLDETMECFSEYYDIIECKKSELTIEPRFDNEVFTIMRKKCKK